MMLGPYHLATAKISTAVFYLAKQSMIWCFEIMLSSWFSVEIAARVSSVVVQY
jgi:hypothetical protein